MIATGEPNECTYCGYDTPNKVKALLSHKADQDWLCPYCEVAVGKGENEVINAMANMFNQLEDRWLLSNSRIVIEVCDYE